MHVSSKGGIRYAHWLGTYVCMCTHGLCLVMHQREAQLQLVRRAMHMSLRRAIFDNHTAVTVLPELALPISRMRRSQNTKHMLMSTKW